MNKELYIEEIDKIVSVITKKGMPVIGCTERQIMALEGEYGPLPCFYKIFLRKMGVSAGNFKEGTWFFFNELQDINEETRNLMKDNNVIPPSNMFAFLMHQGYTSLLFVDVVSFDPAVYCYTEGEDVIDINMTFSQFMKAEINNYFS
ncbi:SMI1/KNR4 family protein [Serratia sp. (in: enterobacteria)]|uniref:SMI1/KNR4 family protein n=1 Tax=Serratia sp. (in: enterobacteria) TaxID=616 RepID=UPI0039891436